jgi:hypothetical protein
VGRRRTRSLSREAGRERDCQQDEPEREKSPVGMAQEGYCTVKVHHLLQNSVKIYEANTRKHYALEIRPERIETAICRLFLCIP